MGYAEGIATGHGFLRCLLDLAAMKALYKIRKRDFNNLKAQLEERITDNQSLGLSFNNHNS
ncbi:Uncharacterised protein [Legionella busanensis]|uniref:Uncharacterized protein n=1 Tax=Legionella busanensis TaxID=190655 RepID=A0A378JLU9_9GAMM|nr:Uncharacterised protein [Legionella busanensis]